MSKDIADRDRRDEKSEVLPEIAAEAISEILAEAQIEIEPQERIILADELLEKFTSPMMIQKAAGATSQVSVTMSPSGGVQDARSVKARNVLVNLKQAAIAVLASLPALASFYQKHGITDAVGTSALAILYFFPILKSLSEVLQIPLTQQAAAILMLMWNAKNENDESVPHEGLLEKVNARFEEYQWKPITADDLVSYLESLERIGSIERDSLSESIAIEKIRWRLKETVRISY
jgi:hypothetical protein